jgi:hypothetical protein
LSRRLQKFSGGSSDDSAIWIEPTKRDRLRPEATHGAFGGATARWGAGTGSSSGVHGVATAPKHLFDHHVSRTAP